ncbi:MAG: amino acid--tRNA ligase-related protein [Leptospira sp.]|nr:amino acid--tRNA ligase-related protein [Leptospira sp.]
MKALSKETQILRPHFLKFTREFLSSNNFLEIDTPIMKPIVGMEPYLDPFLVQSPNGKEKGYLITSPEYSLKQSLASGLNKIYEITHTFRSGEEGSPYHSREFLMLELYVRGADDKALMKLIQEYFLHMIDSFSKFKLKGFQFHLPSEKKVFKFVSVKQEFIECTGKDFSLDALLYLIHAHRLTQIPEEELKLWPYEDLFFLVFLNLVEPKLGEGIVFLYDYPKELAALARVEDGFAKRFEIYWGGLEIANAFFELRNPAEQRARFVAEQKLRQTLGKEVFAMDEDFLAVLENGSFPDASGISLGLDRIFLKLLGKNHLSGLSPYYE